MVAALGGHARARLSSGRKRHERSAARTGGYTRSHNGQFHHTSFEGRAIPFPPTRGRRRVRPVRTVPLRRVVAAVVAVVCGWVGYVVYAEMAASHSLDGRLGAAQQQNATLRRQIAERQAEIAAAQTKQWLIEEARKLGYVLPGERVFVLTTPGAAVPPDGGVDFKSMPAYSVSPSPGGTPAPTQAQVIGPPSGASPTPFVFTFGH